MNKIYLNVENESGPLDTVTSIISACVGIGRGLFAFFLFLPARSNNIAKKRQRKEKVK